MTDVPHPAQPLPQAAGGSPSGLVFRLPASAYLAVLVLCCGVVPLAFAGSGGEQGGATGLTWRVVFLLLPVLAAVFIARTATLVGADGFRVRAAFGSRSVPWQDVQGLSVGPRAIYLVTGDGAYRLPCVRVSDLAAISRLSGGRIPQLPEAPPKFAPSGRRRR